MSLSLSTLEVDAFHFWIGAIKLPKWFLRIQGHKLEEILKELFPKLNKFKKEPELKLEIISKVIDDFPSLIPYDILSLLKEVQDVK